MKSPFEINPLIEVNAKTVSAFAYAMKRGAQERLRILERNNIILNEKEWYSQANFLNAFYEVYHRIGEMNLFLIGSSITKFSIFPPMSNLKEALQSLDIAYHMNHRINGQILYNKNTGETIDGIGNYTLLDFQEEECKAIIQSTSPYPNKFDEGIIHQLVENFKPNKQRSHFVKIDSKSYPKNSGQNSCTYIIEW